MVGFGEAIARFYKGYVNFEGRASRSEYWWPFLMQLIVYVCLVVAFVSIIISDYAENSNAFDGSGLISVFIAWLVFSLINFLPSLAVSARRFHDLDQTGWLVLVFVLMNAFIGVTLFAQLIWFALRGTEGPNQYGPDPLGHDMDVFR